MDTRGKVQINFREAFFAPENPIFFKPHFGLFLSVHTVGHICRINMLMSKLNSSEAKILLFFFAGRWNRIGGRR